MIKRLVPIAILTGLAHFISFFSISFLVKKNVDSNFLVKIAEIESATVFILSILSFGIQQIASRDIATSNDWRKILNNTQVSRTSMSLAIAFIGAIGFFLTKDDYYLIYIIAPLLSLNIDYALYSRGLPIKAAFIALIKVSVPGLTLLYLAINENFIFNIYLISFLLTWVILGIISNKILKAKLIPKPNFNFLKVYFNKIKIGLTDIAITSLKLGVLTLAQPFYNESVIANTFVFLKIYVLVRGIQRVLFQSFYKDLISIEKSRLVDKMGLIFGAVCFVSLIFYNEQIIPFLFSTEYTTDKEIIKLLAVLILFSSISISASPRMLLLKKDKDYINSYLGSLLVLIIALVAFSSLSTGILWALVLGEITLLFFFLKSIYKEIFTKDYSCFSTGVVILIFVSGLMFFLIPNEISIYISGIILITFVVAFVLRNKNQLL